MAAEGAPVPLAAAQVTEASEMLARAFHDDPQEVWLFPDEEKRRLSDALFVGSRRDSSSLPLPAGRQAPRNDRVSERSIGVRKADRADS